MSTYNNNDFKNWTIYVWKGQKGAIKKNKMLFLNFIHMLWIIL